MPSMRSRLSLIHSSTWKGNSANFALTDSKKFAYIEFAAVRIAAVRMLLRAALLLARQKESPPPFAVVGVRAIDL